MKQRFSLVYLDRAFNHSTFSSRIDQLSSGRTDAASRTSWMFHHILACPLSLLTIKTNKMSLSVPESPVFKYITDRWEDHVANTLDPVERLIYRSNLLGQDWRITNTGGGNTSTKLKEKDPLTGEWVSVMWIKGSGGDLRTATRKNFASLYQDQLLALQQLYANESSRGVKSAAEDAMVAAYKHCVFNLNTRAPSIDTPLHSFVPFSHVDHSHPVACIALATAADGPALTHEIYGTDVIWVDWQRPGFELGLKLQAVCADFPEAKGVLLGGHGLINWADSDKACYHLSLALADRAEVFLADRGAGTYAFGGARHKPLNEAARTSVLVDVLPWLRGKVSQHKRCIATLELDPQVVDFVNSEDAPRLAELGTSCPDHFLRTKSSRSTWSGIQGMETWMPLKLHLPKVLSSIERIMQLIMPLIGMRTPHR